MIEQTLLIFVKNPLPGKVKTRLAATVGDDKAMAVYELLLKRTHAITSPLPVQKVVCYTDFTDEEDRWERPVFEKTLQEPGDLGERMRAAFARAFAEGSQRVLIIGSDCYQLTTEIINDAFTALEDHEVVIGPSADGGYYLLGMNMLYPELFEGIAWSTETVREETLAKAAHLGLSAKEMPVLRDVDHEADLVTIPDLEARLRGEVL